MKTFFQQFAPIKVIMSEKIDGNMKIHGDADRFGENRLKFLKKNGISNENVYNALLAHSANVQVISDKSPYLLPDVDALVTNIKKVYLLITVADCYPVLFYDNQKEIIGIAHAGWRGVAKGVLANTVRRMMEMGSNAENIFAAIGPGIGQDHFEFDSSDVQKFFPQYLSEKYVSPGNKEKVFLDLLKIIISQLEILGIKRGNMEISGKCTYCEKNKYFSFRRDKSDPLEAMAVIIGMK